MKKTVRSFPGRSYKSRSLKNGPVLRFLAKVILLCRQLKAAFHRNGQAGRGRRFVMYASGGFIVVAVMMTLVLTGGGNAAPKPEEPSEAPTQIALLSEIPIATTAPDITPIPTTAPDIMETPEPTPKPTKKPKPTPKPTEKPAATPKPSKTPKPVSTPQPAPPPPPQEVSGDMGARPGNADEAAAAFVVQADAYYNDMGYSSNSYAYTENEIKLLARIIEIEARGQPTDGMVAVGNVVLNRVLNSGQSIEQVVKSSAFPYSDGSWSQASMNAASAVLDSEYWVVPQNSYNFKAGKDESNWGSHVFYRKIGGNCFYIDNSGRRNTNGLIPPKLFDRTYRFAQYGCKVQERVKRIQYMLSALGYGGSADGVFGKGTAEALKQFQASQGLGADGVAGTDTVKALINAFGFDNYCVTYYGG